MIDRLSSKLNAQITDFSQYKQLSQGDINAVKGEVTTLKNNYNAKTIKQCLSGTIRIDGENQASAQFYPRFDRTPSLVFGLVSIDAGGAGGVRLDNEFSVTSSSFTVRYWK